MLKKILKLILNTYLRIQHKRGLQNGSSLARTCEFRNSRLTGKVIINKHTQICDSEISGNDVKIGESCHLIRSYLSGNVELKDHVKLLGPLNIFSQSKVSIGSNTTLNGPNFDIYAQINEVTIGKFCSIARNTSFQEYNHKYRRISSYFIQHNIFKEKLKEDIESKGNISVGNDVWIGAGSIILSGTEIGNGCIIAANSVVSGKVPDYSIYGGSPATFIKKRFDEEVIERLNELKWWDWDFNKIKKNKALFKKDLNIEALNNIVD